MTPIRDTAEDRFDADLILERALAADEADLVAHGRPQPTLADAAEAAYRAFEIGVWEMSRDRHAEALPWLSAAVDSGIDEARPLLAICVQVTDPVPERRAATDDEHDQRLAGTLEEQPGETAEEAPTPIYDQVLALAAAWYHHAGTAATAPAESEDASGCRANRLLLPGAAAAVWHAARDGAGTASIDLGWTTSMVKWRSPDLPPRPCSPGLLLQGAVHWAPLEPPTEDTAARTTAANRRARDGADGDPAAAALELIRPLVVRYCRAHLDQRHPDFAGADDIAEEVCAAALVRLPECREHRGSLLRLAYATAAEKITDAMQELGRAQRAGVVLGPALSRWDQQEIGDIVHLNDRLKRVLSALPRAHQEVLVLRVVVGLSAAETAEALGISPGNVRVTQWRALTRLRELVQKESW